jgi:predicted nucleic acid-binding protein
VTSRSGKKAVGRVAADSNVVLSALAGKAALKVFTRSSVEVITTKRVLDEIREYIPTMAASYGLAPEVLEGQLRLLTIREYGPDVFEQQAAEASRRLAHRDPDDCDLLALALALEIPVWSNDNDFEDVGVTRYTTAELLAAIVDE